MRNWDAIARVIHQCWVAYQLGAGQQYNVEPDPGDIESNIRGAMFVLENPNAGPEGQHNEWMRARIEDGWRWGPVKDKEKKLHPDLVPFECLDSAEQRKDTSFRLAAELALKLFPEEE